MSKKVNIFDIFKSFITFFLIIIGIIIIFIIPYAVYWVIQNAIDNQTDILLNKATKLYYSFQ